MTTALVVGIIGAAVGAASGVLGSLTDDYRARERLQRQKNYEEERYSLKKAEAQLHFDAAKEQAERNAAEAEKNASQMNLQADLTDKSLNQSEKSLSIDFNAAIDQLYLSQEAELYNWNSQSIQYGSSEGASYATLGASGVRAGSSLSDAVLMESATNAAQLQFSQDSNRRNSNNSLASVLSNLAGNRIDIQQNRVGADIVRSNAATLRDNAAYLRNSYLEGGSNYNLYKNQQKQLDAEHSYNIDMIDRQWNEHAYWNSGLNAFSSALSLGSKGFSSGYNIGTGIQQGASPNYNKTVGGR